MAVQAKQYLDLTGLQAYDTLIKTWSNSTNQKAYKTVLKTADGNSLNFYLKQNATLSDTADATIELGSTDLANQLAALAEVCGATWDSQNEEYTIALDRTQGQAFPQEVETIVDALNYLNLEVVALNANTPVTVEVIDGTTGSDTLKSYKFYQGLTGQESAAQKEAKRITTVDIPKDYVVKDATVETVTVADEPYSGAVVGDKYIDLEINTNDGTGSGTTRHLYLPFNDLMDGVSGSVGTEVTVEIDEHNEISASINKISGTKIIYIAADVDHGVAEKSVNAALDIINGDATTAGSIAKAKADVIGTSSDAASASTVYGAKAYADAAVGALDTSTDVAIASVSGDTITIQNGVKQEDGLIAQGTGDGITISPIGTTSINSLFPSA